MTSAAIEDPFGNSTNGTSIGNYNNIFLCKRQINRINSQPMQHRVVKLLPSKKVDSILKLTSLK